MDYLVFFRSPLPSSFDNSISYTVCVKDVLHVKDINKDYKGKQILLRNKRFDNGGYCITQPLISFYKKKTNANNKTFTNFYVYGQCKG